MLDTLAFIKTEFFHNRIRDCPHSRKRKNDPLIAKSCCGPNSFFLILLSFLFARERFTVWWFFTHVVVLCFRSWGIPTSFAPSRQRLQSNDILPRRRSELSILWNLDVVCVFQTRFTTWWSRTHVVTLSLQRCLHQSWRRCHTLSGHLDWSQFLSHTSTEEIAGNLLSATEASSVVLSCAPEHLGIIPRCFLIHDVHNRCCLDDKFCDLAFNCEGLSRILLSFAIYAVSSCTMEIRSHPISDPAHETKLRYQVSQRHTRRTKETLQKWKTRHGRSTWLGTCSTQTTRTRALWWTEYGILESFSLSSLHWASLLSIMSYVMLQRLPKLPHLCWRLPSDWDLLHFFLTKSRICDFHLSQWCFAVALSFSPSLSLFAPSLSDVYFFVSVSFRRDLWCQTEWHCLTYDNKSRMLSLRFGVATWSQHPDMRLYEVTRVTGTSRITIIIYRLMYSRFLIFVDS